MGKVLKFPKREIPTAKDLMTKTADWLIANDIDRDTLILAFEVFHSLGMVGMKEHYNDLVEKLMKRIDS